MSYIKQMFLWCATGFFTEHQFTFSTGSFITQNNVYVLMTHMKNLYESSDLQHFNIYHQK